MGLWFFYMKKEYLLAVRQILFAGKLNCYLIFRYIYLLSLLCTLFYIQKFFHTRSFNSKPCKRVVNLQHNMVHRVDILELTFFISHACLDSIHGSIFTLCIPFIMGWDLFWLIILSFCAKANYVYEIYHQISLHTFNMYFWKAV